MHARITDTILDLTMREGELPPEVRERSPLVVALFTQDWCPQWTHMAEWLLPLAEEREDLSVFWTEYNRSPLFAPFLTFKETTWGNHLIPYLRYYHRGRLFHESNYVSRPMFMDILTAKEVL